MSLSGHARRALGSRAGLVVLLLAAIPVTIPATTLPAGAQSDPALHKRPPGGEQTAPASTVATGHSDLPPEAEGQYPWGKNGSEIELYFEEGKLHGYMTEHLDPDPHAAPATFDFVTTHVDGNALQWTTSVVHGTSYSFAGHLERGLAKSPTLPGYYMLTGTLAGHGDGAFTRTVSLKREPGTP